MVCYAAQQNLLRPDRGNSGAIPSCVTTLPGLFIGDTMKQIQLVNNKGFVVVDDEDFAEMSKHKWHLDERKNTSYAKTFIRKGNRRVKVGIHQLIMNAKKGQEIDHRDGDGLYNCKCNLRHCSTQQNSMNRKTNYGSSNYKGVHWHKRDKKWYSSIGLNYKSLHLGRFDSEIEAARAYNDKAIEMFGEFARLNEIPTG